MAECLLVVGMVVGRERRRDEGRKSSSNEPTSFLLTTTRPDRIFSSKQTSKPVRDAPAAAADDTNTPPAWLSLLSPARRQMADARSLLRAKKATTVPKVDSPHATYTATGELKCVLCAVKGEYASVNRAA